MIQEQITEISSLPYNWDGYGSLPVFPQVVQRAEAFIVCLDGEILELLSDVYPNSHGTISFEWEKNRDEKLLLEIGTDNYAYFLNQRNKPSIFRNGNDPLVDKKEITKHLQALYQDQNASGHCSQ